MNSRAEELLEILRLIEKASQPVLYDERYQQKTIVEFAEDRLKLIQHLWGLYEGLAGQEFMPTPKPAEGNI